MARTTYDGFVDDQWYGPENAGYVTLALAGEVGELANFVKKEIRDGVDKSEDVKAELGDVLYYFVKLCHLRGYQLNDIVEANMVKLTNRRKTDYEHKKAIESSGLSTILGQEPVTR